MKKWLLLISIILVVVVYLIFNSLFTQEIPPEHSKQSLNEPNSISTVQERQAFFQANEDSFDIEVSQIKPFPAVMSQIDKNRVLDDAEKLLLIDDKNLDKHVLDFLKDKKISRSEKISTILTLLDKVGLDSTKGAYFIDVLDSLKPIEIADQLINKFQSDNISNNTKNAIMRVLANSYGLDPAKVSGDIAKLIAQNSISIQDFFSQQIQNPTNKEVFKQAIMLYPSVSSAEEAVILDNALNKHQDLLSIQEGLNIRLDSALATQQVQENNLPQLLNDMQKDMVKPEIKQEFNNRLFGLLKDPSAEAVVSDTTKPSVAKYIETQEPVLNTTNVEFNALNNYHAWLESYAAMSSNKDQQQAFIADYAASSATPIQQAAVVVFGDDKLVSELRQNSTIQNNLQKELANPELATEAKQVIQDAVQRLQTQ